MPSLTLQSNDGKEFIVDPEIVMCSSVISDMLQANLETNYEDVVPLPKVDAQTLERVIEWANYHMNDPLITPIPRHSTEMNEWNSSFMRDWDQDTLFKVLKAADYLGIEALLKLTSKKVLEMIKGKTAVELREFLKFEKGEERKVIMLGGANENVPHVTVQCSDGLIYGVELHTAKLVPKIVSLLEETELAEGRKQPVQLATAFSEKFEKLIEWVEYHQDKAVGSLNTANNQEDHPSHASEWNETFLGEFGFGDLFELIVLAKDLEVHGLVRVVNEKLASMMIGKTAQELREMFHLKNDFTSEELERTLKENEWCAEK